MVRLHILILFVLTNLVSSLSFAEDGYGSKMAMISHIHAAGFDHVIEISVQGDYFTNFYKRNDQFVGSQGFHGYKRAYGMIRKPSLDYMKTNFGRPVHMMFAFQVGDSFICYTNSLETDHRSSVQKAFNAETKREIRGLNHCLIIPTGVSSVLKALRVTPEQEVSETIAVEEDE